MGFLNAELVRAGLPLLDNQVIDTLKVAKDLHPGKKNNLNALCDRYMVDNSHRILHGALLDTELLAEVYLAMTRGQESLLSDEAAAHDDPADLSVGDRPRLIVRVVQASEAELVLHTQQLADIDKASKGSCLWNNL